MCWVCESGAMAVLRRLEVQKRPGSGYFDKRKKVIRMSSDRFEDKSFKMRDKSSLLVKEGSAKLPPFGEKGKAMRITYRII